MYKNVGKKSIFYFLNSNSKILLLALLTNINNWPQKALSGHLDACTISAGSALSKRENNKTPNLLFWMTHALTET